MTTRRTHGNPSPGSVANGRDSQTTTLSDTAMALRGLSPTFFFLMGNHMSQRKLFSQELWYRRVSHSLFVLGLFCAGISGCSSSTPSEGGSATPQPFDVISPHDVTPQLSNLQGADFGRAPMEVKVSHFVAKHGVDSVVGVRLEPFSSEHQRVIRDRMRDGMANFEEFSQWQGNRAVVYIAPVSDVNAFAEKLDLGDFEVDAARRVIRIQTDEEKLNSGDR